ncbi:glycoside hydrolase superfamily [Mycena rebaudengoi]|nr:glycoside hydrolase superfamily [Mycena rebaudengoi]
MTRHESMIDTSSNVLKQRGVNLGSWFVLERWIAETPFRHALAPAQSDLDVARGLHAKEILEAHYDSWITESDLGSRSQHRTDFEDFGHVFVGAWARLIHAIKTAHRFGLGVLLDLHAAPGKQNKDSHAGTSNPPTFFTERRNRTHTLDEPTLVNIIGIELLNEPQPSSDSMLKIWYSTAMKELAAIDPSLPIYLGDCWKMEYYADYIKSTPHSSPLILVHHLYRCFTSSDIRTSAPEHTRSLMDEDAHTPRMFSQVKNYISAQLTLYEKHCGGYFFWTYKKQGSRPDRGLSVCCGSSTNLIRSLRLAGDHTAYWSKYPGKYHHARFSDGFASGWDDAYSFFTSGSQGVPELGTRTNDHGSSFWEFCMSFERNSFHL